MTIAPIAGTSPSSLAGAAQADTADGLAYRYALVHLNPFVVTGTDAVTGALYAPHNASGALDLYDPLTGAGSLSELYLADRARMLALCIRLDTADAAQEYLSVEGEATFSDARLGLTLIANAGPAPDPPGGPGPTFDRAFVRFGSEAAETSGQLDGGVVADHLYGGIRPARAFRRLIRAETTALCRAARPRHLNRQDNNTVTGES